MLRGHIVCKIWFYPPPPLKRPQKVENPFYGQNDFVDIWAFRGVYFRYFGGCLGVPELGWWKFRVWPSQVSVARAHTDGGVQQRTLFRRFLRSVLETAFEKVLRRVLRRCLAVGFNGKKGSEKGSFQGF